MLGALSDAANNSLGDIVGDLEVVMSLRGAVADDSFLGVITMGGSVSVTVVAAADEEPPLPRSLMAGSFCSGTKFSSNRYDEPLRVFELLNSIRYDDINAFELSGSGTSCPRTGVLIGCVDRVC